VIAEPASATSPLFAAVSPIKTLPCICNSDSIDLNQMISNDPLKLRSQAFMFGVQGRIDESIEHVQSNREKSERLELAIKFVDLCLVDAFRTGEFNELSHITFFPSTEAQMEFDQSIKHALIGSYKSAYGFLRRGLELSLLHIYFAVTKNYQKSRDWLNSERNTEFFSTIINKIFKDARFSEFEEQTSWKEKVQTLYWEIADVLHVKGMKKGFREMNSPRSYISGTHFESVSMSSLDDFIDAYIAVIENICVAVALYNPILVVGLDLDNKFGMGGPISGFFYPGQSEMLNSLIPSDYKQHIEKLQSSDEEVTGLVEWFNGQPDITEEQFQKQVEEFNKQIKNPQSKREESE